MAKHNTTQDSTWQRCPAGLIQRIAVDSERTHGQRNAGSNSILADRRNLLKIAAVVTVTAGAGVIAFRSSSAIEDQDQAAPVNRDQFASANRAGHGGISCKTCIDNLPQYIEKSLDVKEFVVEMVEHLRICDACRSRLEEMQNA